MAFVGAPYLQGRDWDLGCEVAFCIVTLSAEGADGYRVSHDTR